MENMFSFDEDNGINGFGSTENVYDQVPFLEKVYEHIYDDIEFPFPEDFDDHYYFIENGCLGSGACGTVETVVSYDDGKEYAVKIIRKGNETHTRLRIYNEVKLFCLSKHNPYIVELIDVFEDEQNYYMVFEKMSGGPLLDHILKKTCFTEQEASLVTSKIAKGIKFLHDHGVAHRDIKPENVLVSSNNGLDIVKLCDLDLATKPNSFGHLNSDSSEDLSDGDFESPVGSAEFMAPEVVNRFMDENLKYDKKADSWSLGVLIYIMLCGYPPFYGQCESPDCNWDKGACCQECQKSLFDHIKTGIFDFPDPEWSNISDDAKDVIAKLLVVNPQKRYTIDDVLMHPWITKKNATIPLLTADYLVRNESSRDINLFYENINGYHNYTSTNHGSFIAPAQTPISSTKYKEFVDKKQPQQLNYNNFDDSYINAESIHSQNDHYNKVAGLSIYCEDINRFKTKPSHELSPTGTVDSGVSDLSLSSSNTKNHSAEEKYAKSSDDNNSSKSSTSNNSNKNKRFNKKGKSKGANNQNNYKKSNKKKKQQTCANEEKDLIKEFHNMGKITVSASK